MQAEATLPIYNVIYTKSQLTSITKANMLYASLHVITHAENMWPQKIAGGNNICNTCDIMTRLYYNISQCHPDTAWPIHLANTYIP